MQRPVLSFELRWRIVLAIFCGLLLAHLAPAKAAAIQRPYWSIVATVIDRSTSEQLKQATITGQGLEFDDRAQCLALVRKLPPAKSDQFAVVLTCQRIGPGEVYA